MPREDERVRNKPLIVLEHGCILIITTFWTAANSNRLPSPGTTESSQLSDMSGLAENLWLSFSSAATLITPTTSEQTATGKQHAHCS